MKRLFYFVVWFLFLTISVKSILNIKQPKIQITTNHSLYPDLRIPYISSGKSMISENEFQKLLDRNQKLRKLLFKKKVLK